MTIFTAVKLKNFKSLVDFEVKFPNYEHMYFSGTEVVDKPVIMIGKAIELRRRF